MSLPEVRATTVLAVRRDGRVAMGGDGQVTMGDTVVKGKARKVRALKDGTILASFAGAVAFAVFLIQAFSASRLLEAVNYFEHWGLTRRVHRVIWIPELRR